MNSFAVSSHGAAQSQLFALLAAQYPGLCQVPALFEEFLRHEAYDHGFCLELMALARQKTKAPWSLRRLAVLMLEHQILKLDPGNLEEFDFLLVQLKLKPTPGLVEAMAESVLKEGYSSTHLPAFIFEFRRKLARLNRIHARICGPKTPVTALEDFIGLSRRDCKLALARYLFTPDEIVSEILRQVQISTGVRDLDASSPRKGETRMADAIARLPEFEGQILKRLCGDSRVYWVSQTTSSQINSLVEYPLTTVVLAIKPPGSDIEIEIKRAGRRGRHPLSVVYARNGAAVPPSHRLDGGNMLWLLQYEANAAARFQGIYRLVHKTRAPMAEYLSRSTIYSVPVRDVEVQTIPFFTDPKVFGKDFGEMRAAMKEAVAAFCAEGNNLLPEIPGELGLTAQFLGHVAPAQAILCGTTSFRLDKLALYLSGKGPETYFGQGLGVAYSRQDERRLADELLEEVLGVYSPPQDPYQTYEQYLAAAFRVPENRRLANQIYSSLLQQIGRFWGTLLGVRGYSRGESFVARNVGLKSFWDNGQWNVRLIFMDHDALVIPAPHDEKFYARGAIPNMAFDDSYIWGTASLQQFARSAAGCLGRIYHIDRAFAAAGLALARAALKQAYRKTQHELLNNQRLGGVFHKDFLNRLLDWDTIVSGYFRLTPNTLEAQRWEKEMKALLAAKGYGKGALEANLETIEENRDFLERNLDLFDLGNKSNHQGNSKPFRKMD